MSLEQRIEALEKKVNRLLLKLDEDEIKRRSDMYLLSRLGAENLRDGAITAPKIVDFAITDQKLAEAAVTTEKLADYAVDVDKLADLAVTARAIADGEVTMPKIGDAAVSSEKIKEKAILGEHIEAAAIGTVHIEEGAIVNAHIVDAAIDTAKIAEAAITSAHIQDAAIGSAAIAGAAIGTAHIAEGVILSAHIGEAQIKSANIDELAVNSAHIANLAVDSLKLADYAVTTDKIHPDAITTSMITVGFGTTFEEGYNPLEKLAADAVGELAFYDVVEAALLGETVIIGGYIKTDLIKVGDGVVFEPGYNPIEKATPDDIDAAVADKVTQTQLSQAISIFDSSLGDLAYEDMVEDAKLGTTIVQGGFIRSELLTADNIVTGKLAAARIDTTDLYAERIYQPNSPNSYGQIGGSYGDLILYRNGSEYFRIYNALDHIALRRNSTSFLTTTGSVTYPQGTWDFNNATATNLEAVAVFG